MRQARVIAAAAALAAALPSAALGAMPGRNGALLISASVEQGDECAAPGPPRIIARIADYVCDDEPPYAVFLAGPTRGVVRWLDGESWAPGTFWPGGRRVVLTRAADHQLYAAPLDAEPRPLPLGRKGHSPAVSADGRRVAFVVGSSEPTVYVARLRGGAARRLSEGSSPRWSSTGRVALTDKGDVLVSDTGGVAVRPLMRGARSGAERFYDWSPDGRQLLVSVGMSCGRDSTRHALFAVSLDGRTVRRLTSYGPCAGFAGPFAESALWSPDGRRIAFLRSNGFGVKFIYTIAADGHSPAGWRTWRKVVGAAAELHDWQSLR